MEHETFWKTLDAAREAAQRAGQSAGEALDALSAAARDADLYERCRAGAEYLQKQLGNFRPEVLLILGSGLGFLGDEVEHPAFAEYSAIPYFKHSTAPGHRGRFVFGTLRGKRVAVMQGRMHTYEGWSMADAAQGVRVLRLLGAQTLIVTNAAGAVNTAFHAGDIMLIRDHI